MTPTSAVEQRPYDEMDLSSRTFWCGTAAERERSFAVLRAERPVSWHRPPETFAGELEQGQSGFWAVVRHKDIVEVSRRSDVFVSGYGTQPLDLPPEWREATESIIGMDAPRHTKLRKIVSAAFTPRQVRRIEEQIKANAKTIVEELAAAGTGVDFVRHCASQLPLRTLSDMVGIPDDERDAVVQAAEALVCAGDPEFLQGRDAEQVVVSSQMELHRVALELASRRRTDPRDDLMSALVHAEVDGEQLTHEEIAAFFALLCVAGNDTTRQTTSHTLKALTDFPEQREWLMADFDGRINGAIEEFVRWATPVMTFRRTAISDYELGGQPIRAGEKVVMFYASGNWDTEVFAQPDRFDLSRNPNAHLSFGGGGAHYCLGNQVAKTQLRALFGELLTQLPDIQGVEPEYLESSFIHAVRAMTCTFAS